MGPSDCCELSLLEPTFHPGPYFSVSMEAVLSLKLPRVVQHCSCGLYTRVGQFRCFVWPLGKAVHLGPKCSATWLNSLTTHPTGSQLPMVSQGFSHSCCHLASCLPSIALISSNQVIMRSLGSQSATTMLPASFLSSPYLSDLQLLSFVVRGSLS